MRLFRDVAGVLFALALFSRPIAAGAFQIDTVSLWGTQRRHHKADVQLHIYRPDNPSGTAVIVCPGGSYFWLDEKGEGDDVGAWLCSKGITAFVLFYRTAGAPEFVWHTRIMFRGVRHPDMIEDAQMALKWVRDHSDRFSIASDRTGLLGFSAGGHLVLSCACFHRSSFIGEAGLLCGQDLRPSFVAAVYPVVTMNGPYAHRRSRRGLLGDRGQGKKILRDSLSLEKHIPQDCPPVFVINCKDDPVVDYRNSIILDSALSSGGIEHKYIQYLTGKHGFGVSDHYGSEQSRQWRGEFLQWLDSLFPAGPHL